MTKSLPTSSILLICLMMILFLNCPEYSVRSINNITIKDVDWVAENIDHTYWNNGFDEAYCFYNFWIYLEGEDITLSNIKSLRIHYDADNFFSYYWTIPLDSLNFNKKNKVLGGWNKYYANNYSTNGSVLPAEIYIILELSGGAIIHKLLNITAPGHIIYTPKLIYTEDYILPKSSDYYPVVKRAILGDAIKNETTNKIVINFKITDSLAYSGWVWFFDVNNNFAGTTKEYFRDYEDGSISTFLNNGIAFNINGNDNTIDINVNEDITYQDGFNKDNIAIFNIVLTDGFQYLYDIKTYDCRSISAKKIVVIE